MHVRIFGDVGVRGCCLGWKEGLHRRHLLVYILLALDACGDGSRGSPRHDWEAVQKLTVHPRHGDVDQAFAQLIHSRWDRGALPVSVAPVAFPRELLILLHPVAVPQRPRLPDV
jgi:hypothetical protein